MIYTFAVLGNYTITKIFKHRVRQALVPLTRAPNPVRKEETTLIQTGSKVSLCVRGLCDPCVKFLIHFKLKFRSFQNSKFPSLNSFLPLAPIFFFFIRLCSDQFSLLIVDAKIMANGYSSDNTSDEHCAGGSSGGLIRLQGDQVIHPTSGFPLLRPVALASSADNILLDVHNYLSILLDLHNYLSNSSDHTQPGAQEPMTRSEQPLCARVTAFSRIGLFLKRFWREF